MIFGKPVAQPRDTLRRLAGFDRLGRAQIIAPAPGMGFDIAERLGLLHHVVQRQRKGCVFVDIGGIACVVKMLIGQHEAVIGQFAVLR